MNKRFGPSSVIFIVLAALSAGSATCRAADLSTPAAALKTFGNAMQDGDADGVKAASINVKPDIIDSMCGMMKSTKALHDAAVAKFGADGESVSPAFKANVASQLADAKIEENGDTATVTPTRGQPLTMHKTDGQWKVDFANMPGMDKAEAMLPMMSKMAAANNATADDVTAGRFATAAEAKKALGKKMMAAFMPTTTQAK